jgi:hypothetical protein
MQRMFDTHAELIATQPATPTILRAITRNLPAEITRVGGQDEDAWSAVEVVCHLRDAEEIALDRVRRMRDEYAPLMDDYDQASLAVERRYNAQSLPEAVEAFAGLRAQMLAIIESLDEDGWSRPGIIGDAGELTIFSYLTHRVMHDAVHLAQIGRRVLAGGGV